MIRHRHFALVALLTLLASFGTLVLAPVSRVAAQAPSTRLSDAEFWRLVTEFSEPTGSFLSDNFVSNEDMFQQVIPRLTQSTKPGGAYLGVGPDQNFTYIVALQPRVAFIIDIRRQNLILHLLYKALIELSDDRAELLSRLFSRPRPSGLGPTSGPDILIEAYARVASSDTLFQTNLRAVVDQLVQHHRFALTSNDLSALEYVYTAFFLGGPDIRYSIPTIYNLRFPTYGELIRQTDGQGAQHSYLATEENFRVLKGLEEQNLIIPLVGNFAGDKALPAVSRYLSEQGTTVTAFYLSNVEKYLFDDAISWKKFYANVAALPMNESSTLIRTYDLAGKTQGQVTTWPLATALDSMKDLVRAIQEGRIGRYSDVLQRSR